MKHRGTAVFFLLFLVAVITLPMSLSCGPIELGATPGFTINAEECRPFSIQFTSSNTTCPSPVIFYWLVGTLPPYANFDNVTGTLTGCPQVGDPSAIFVVGVSEFSPPACGPYLDMDFVTINVIPTAPVCDMVIDPVFYPVAWEEYPFAMDLNVTNGVGPFTWSTSALPAGLALTDPENGLIEGILEPGTCGIYTVTATVTDLGTCCCSPVNRDFILIVDCWANYPPSYYGPTGCDFSVQIGPGLTQGQTSVLIDGAPEATLAGGQTESFTSSPCESHLIMVDQTVQTANTRFSVIGSNTKQITDIDNTAYFDYAPELYIGTASNPSGIAQPTGAGFYTVGSYFNGTTPGTVEADTQQGIKYVFREWQLPDGSKSPTREVLFTVNQAGTAIAQYDTYYQLTLKSDYPAIDERSWERQGSTATWNLSLHAVPLQGFWGFLGGVQSPLNASGSQLITGPTTVEIQWRPNYTMPIVAIIIVLLVIVGLIVLIFRLRSRTSAGTGDKKASSKAKEPEDKSFCSKCGAAVDKDADFCKKCGNKLK
jgi:ribosomal protein L40E